MDARQAFKCGFIARCVEDGFTTPEQINQLLKSADFDALKALGSLASGVGNVASTGINWGVPLALAAPPILGAVGGTMAGKATDVDDYDVAEAKNQEIVDEYRRQAERVRRESMLRKLQQSRQGSGKVFL